MPRPTLGIEGRPRRVCYIIDMKSYISHSLDETKEIAAQWLKDLAQKYQSKDEATLVGFSGHLGAGKTAYVKMLGKVLNIKEEITSPTFVLMKIYQMDYAPWKRLIHIDAYRLEKREELDVLEWEKLVADPCNLIIVEWPENVSLKEFSELCSLSFLAIEKTHTIEIT